jgi:hypothetical protein
MLRVYTEKGPALQIAGLIRRKVQKLDFNPTLIFHPLDKENTLRASGASQGQAPPARSLFISDLIGTAWETR